jgi:Fe-S cluster biosynthesis and repair protein YggX
LNNYENEFAKKLKGYSTEKYRIDAWRNWKHAHAKLIELNEDMFNAYRDERRKYVKDSSIRLDFAVITALFVDADRKLTH